MPQVVCEVEVKPCREVDEGQGHKLDKEVVVVGAYAIHDHPAVMIVLEAARVTLGAVVHPRTLVNFTV